MSDAVIQLSHVWKIFGERSAVAEALQAVQNEGLGKEEILARTGCVVGIADASFEVKRGEIFCIMGLSGSGKSTLVRHVNRGTPAAGLESAQNRYGVSAYGAATAPYRARQRGVSARSARRAQIQTLGDFPARAIAG